MHTQKHQALLSSSAKAWNTVYLRGQEVTDSLGPATIYYNDNPPCQTRVPGACEGRMPSNLKLNTDNLEKGPYINADMIDDQYKRSANFHFIILTFVPLTQTIGYTCIRINHVSRGKVRLDTEVT